MTESKYSSLIAAAGPVSRETFEMLLEFETHFVKWSEAINLVSYSTLREVWSRHILDSAQLVALAPSASKWLDLGSGGGFPGLVVAILMKERQGGWVDLVESNRKKSGFLQAMTGRFNLPAKVHAVRIEAVSDIEPEIVTCRALTALPNLFDLASKWLCRHSVGLFHKGREYRSELAETTEHWTFDLVEHLSRCDGQGVILEVSNLGRATHSDVMTERSEDKAVE